MELEHPRLLPAVLVPDPDADPRRRTTRDWIVDFSCFLIAFVGGFLVFAEGVDRMSDELQFYDLVGGALACTALWWRRRWPVGVALFVLAFNCYSSSAAIAGAISIFTVAVHRRAAVAVGLGCLGVAVTPILVAIQPQDPETPFWASMVIAVLGTAGVIAWGMFVRARRQLVFSLRDRAERAEAEQQLRVEQARQQERARIAREMHDVLAHRISLLSLHAGALEFRPDAPPDEVARAAGVIRASAHDALEDLRAVIGVLREGADGGDPERPQPTLADLPALIEESRAAGMQVRYEGRAELEAVPVTTGRNAYRIVQEGLTNARKHAQGAAVEVVVEGAPGHRADDRDPQPAAGRRRRGAAHPRDRDGHRGARGACEPGRRAARARLHAGRRLPAVGVAAVAGVIRVLIVDDDALVRAGLSMMLAGTEDIRVVAEASDGAEVASAVDAYGPDVVLMDIRMPGVDGLAATELLRARETAPQVIVLTTFHADDQVLRALRAGAAGFLLKDTPPPEIMRAIRLVAAGEAMLSPAVTRRLIEQVADDGLGAGRARARELLDRLTDREREVAIAIGQGKSNAEIAAELYMSVATVKAHVSRLLAKLEVGNRVQIALLAHDAGVA